MSVLEIVIQDVRLWFRQIVVRVKFRFYMWRMRRAMKRLEVAIGNAFLPVVKEATIAMSAFADAIERKE